MALTATPKRVYEGNNVTLADIRQLIADTADWPADSPFHVQLAVADGEVRFVVEQASV